MASLYEQWEDLILNQTEDTFNDFWKEYSDTETRIYSAILDNPNEKISGKLSDLAKRFDADSVIFMGFLDGVDTSLKESNNFKNFDEDSEVNIEIDIERLYFNMLKAEADYLFTLPQWDTLLTEEKKKEIAREYKKTKTIIKENKVGRNDPCPCGSGKKFKKCCGR